MCSFMRENNHLKAILIMKSDLQAWWSGNSFVKKKKNLLSFFERDFEVPNAANYSLESKDYPSNF